MTQGKILVVDDDDAIRLVIHEALSREGHEVRTAASVAEQAKILSQFEPDVLVTDVILPDGNGLDLVPEILARRPDLPVIVLSAQNTLATAVRATEQGAFEYLPKPFDLDELCQAVKDGLRRRGISSVQPALSEADAALPLIGRSPAMQEVYRTIARVVPNDLTVLILGESGTGKELVARAIHDLGPRKTAPFVAINMAAIPRDLIEAELFGHERGAFTGAQQRSAGRFEQAAGGTLFLDEIGDMPMDAQTLLLRVLQSGEFTTVGGNRAIRADVRIIAATHKNLEKMIEDGSFREDLYYRLNVFPIEMAPLRERIEDIPLLMNELISRMEYEKRGSIRFNSAAIMSLCRHDWAGNVRELANLVERMAIMHPYGVIGVGELPKKFRHVDDEDESMVASLRDELDERATLMAGLPGVDSMAMLPPEGLDLKDYLGNLEQGLIQQALDDASGVVARAAERLRIRRTTLVEKMRKYGMTRRDDEGLDD